jgi:holo-[acyl-carrier protein] synthase
MVYIHRLSTVIYDKPKAHIMNYVGIDAVEIERFILWHTFTHKKLERIFTPQEIAYCLQDTMQAAQRFATRFAAKEAFYKALNPLLKKPLPFLTICKEIEILNDPYTHYPRILCNWERLSIAHHIQASCSLTHTKSTAIAIIILTDDQKLARD